MIKPDGVQRGLVGQIISKFEAKAQWNITMPLFVIMLGPLDAVWRS